MGEALKERENPWGGIPAGDYEKHMSHAAVQQWQVLSEMVREQYEDYMPRKMAYLGVCTGNGLEHVRKDVTDVVYGIDISEQFLEICAGRHAQRIGSLHLVKMDLNRECCEVDKVDLVIANLVLEFVDTDRFLEQVEAFDHGETVASVVFQIKNKVPVVSDSGVTSLKILSCFNREVGEVKLKDEMERKGYAVLKSSRRTLPDGKEFVRVDFRKAGVAAGILS